MGRRRRGVPFAKGQKFCVFCGGPGLTKTHIWPKWLNELLAPPTGGEIMLERPAYSGRPSERQALRGSIFSQKPYLACKVCNEALGTLENEMKTFAPPLFSSADAALTLTVDQQRTLAGWISAITILAEHIDKSKSSLAIPQREYLYVKEHRAPPSSWSICCASLDAKVWAAKYRHRTTFIGDFSSEAEFWAAARRGPKPNTQLSSFGIGKIFFQVFTCPDPRFVADFRAVTVATELGQIWPIPLGIFRSRTLELPTDLVITDETADALADSYAERIKALTGRFGI